MSFSCGIQLQDCESVPLYLKKSGICHAKSLLQKLKIFANTVWAECPMEWLWAVSFLSVAIAKVEPKWHMQKKSKDLLLLFLQWANIFICLFLTYFKYNVFIQKIIIFTIGEAEQATTNKVNAEFVLYVYTCMLSANWKRLSRTMAGPSCFIITMTYM